MKLRPVVLSIGTSEPWAAAGIHLDLRISGQLDIQLRTCIVAVSAQDGIGSLQMQPMPAEIIRAQLASVDQGNVASIRIGAFCSHETALELASILATQTVPVVYDPVLATSSGQSFLDSASIETMRKLILPHVTLLTPNLDEAEQLSQQRVRSVQEMEKAAQRIAALGPKAVLIKGGHLEGAPVDVLWDGEQIHRFVGTRLAHGMRGTGCIMALACAAGLAYQRSLHHSVRDARELIRAAIENATNAGRFWIAA